MKPVVHSFVWDLHYITDLHDVDRQHLHLVNLLNALAASETRIHKETVERLFTQLTEYAQSHFDEEESLMVLQRLAQTLRDFSRTDDLACGVGGDEFMVLCPNTSAENALSFAQALLARVNTLRVAAGGGFWEGSVSIGVATNTDDMTTMTDLIKTADEALYAAKAAGKNCVRQSVSA